MWFLLNNVGAVETILFLIINKEELNRHNNIPYCGKSKMELRLGFHREPMEHFAW